MADMSDGDHVANFTAEINDAPPGISQAQIDAMADMSDGDHVATCTAQRSNVPPVVT